MSHYLLAVHTDSQPRELSEEDMRHGYAKVAALEAEMRDAGVLVYSGRLEAPGLARVVRPSKPHVRTTDGPYVETKEHLGGFYIIEAADSDRALEWASKVTEAINTPIELRPFFDHAAVPS